MEHRDYYACDTKAGSSMDVDHCHEDQQKEKEEEQEPFPQIRGLRKIQAIFIGM